MKILFIIIFLLASVLDTDAVTRFSIPGAGATGCANGSTNYNPATNTCGSGSSTVYTTAAGCLTSFPVATAGSGANNACAVRAGTYVEMISNIVPGGSSASARFDWYCYDGLYSCRIDPGTHSLEILRIGHANQKHIRVRFFEFDARGQTASAEILSHANNSGITGNIYESNWFRGGAQSGPCIAFADSNSNFIIRSNIIEGCMGVPTGGSGSHGIYAKANVAGHLIEKNIIRDNYSHGVHCYSSTGSCNGITIRKNLIKNNGARCMIATNGSGAIIDSNLCIGNGHNPEAASSECIRINSHSNAKVYNNLCYDHKNTNTRISIDGSGAIIYNNICTNVSTSGTCVGGSAATTADNLTSNPGFTNTATDDFSLTASATTAINQGTNISGFPFNGINRDIGPHETFQQISAVATGNNIDITFGMNLNVPLLPATGITGFTVNNGRTVTSAERLTGTDSVIRLTFDGAACTGGQTWTYSYSGGNVTDSALIGGTKNQPLHAITNQAVTNECASTNPATIRQAAYQFNLLYKDLKGNMTKLPGIASAANSPIKVTNGSALSLDIQTNCDNVADCDPLGQTLQYDVNLSGTWTSVLDTVSTASFYGTSDTSSGLPTGEPPCPLTGALTCVAGGTQSTASAIPIVDMAQNNSTVGRYLIVVNPDTNTLRFRLINQNGTVFNNYDVYPTITGIPAVAGVGM